MNLPPFNDGFFMKDKGIVSSAAWRRWFKGLAEYLNGLSGGSGTPITPSGSVVSETSYNQVTNPGTASSFSRGDHTHGSPSDANIPTANEKAALVGTHGAASGANKYVTNSDPRNSDARTPTAHAASHAPGASDYLTDYYATMKKTAVSSYPYNILVDDNFLVLTDSGYMQLPDPAVYGNRTLLVSGGSGGTVVIRYGKLVVSSYIAPRFVWVSSNGVVWSSRVMYHSAQHSATGGDPVDHDTLLNYAANEHFTEASIDHANILNIGTTSHANIDLQIPSSDEKAALVGTSGTPSVTNKYVTNDDARNTDARTPTAHNTTHQNGGSDEIATATAAANAIPKADVTGSLDVGWIPSLTNLYATLKKTVVSSFPYTVLNDDNFLELSGSGQINLPDPAVYGARTLLIEGGSGSVTVDYVGVIIAYTAPSYIWVSSDGATWTANAVAHSHAHSTTGLDALSAADIGAAPAAEGVTNGNSHDHSGGDGAQINHTTLSNIGTNTHAQIDTHVGSTTNPHTTTDANLSTSDVTTNNGSTSKHGFMPKVPNDATKGISGVDGTWGIVGYSPIGSITAWHKSFASTPALPSNWVECNGQTLSDADSVYNGQVIPNLNGAATGADLSNGDNLGKTGEVFLKGDETSGVTQFDSFQGHYHTIPGSGGAMSWAQVGSGSGFSGWSTTDPHVNVNQITATTSPITDGVNETPRTASTTKPRNMTVVWIMRIK